MRYKIVQLIDIKDVDYAFMDFAFAKSHGFRFSDYKIVYEGVINEDNVNNALERLFVEFNCNRPSDFKGHSLSVSDIVELDGVAYYCNPTGWEAGI